MCGQSAQLNGTVAVFASLLHAGCGHGFVTRKLAYPSHAHIVPSLPFYNTVVPGLAVVADRKSTRNRAGLRVSYREGHGCVPLSQLNAGEVFRWQTSLLASKFRVLQRSCISCDLVPCALQDMERDDYKAAGYNKLHELRLLKAAARVLLQPEAQESSSGNASIAGHAASPLMRSFSNIEHVMPSQLQRSLSRTPSGTPAFPSLPPPPRLGRSNSAGSHRLAGYLPQPPPQVLVQPSSARAAVPAVPTAQGFESVAQPMWPRPPRFSEPTAGGASPDERVELLLAEVRNTVPRALAGSTPVILDAN